MVSDLKTFAHKGSKKAEERKKKLNQSLLIKSIKSRFLLYRCYYLHWLRNASSPVYGIFLKLMANKEKGINNFFCSWIHTYKTVVFFAQVYARLVLYYVSVDLSLIGWSETKYIDRGTVLATFCRMQGKYETDYTHCQSFMTCCTLQIEHT